MSNIWLPPPFNLELLRSSLRDSSQLVSLSRKGDEATKKIPQQIKILGNFRETIFIPTLTFHPSVEELLSWNLLIFPPIISR